MQGCGSCELLHRNSYLDKWGKMAGINLDYGRTRLYFAHMIMPFAIIITHMHIAASPLM